MSKITKALEKAARERIQRTQERPTVPTRAPLVVPVSAHSVVGELAPAGQVAIDPHVIAAADDASPIAEQYRILRTNFQSIRGRIGTTGSKVIVVTSAVSGEGKSITALNLAFMMARQDNLRVVLVDADLRKSSIPRWLGLPDGRAGLSTVLQRNGDLNGELVSFLSSRLAVLPAGPTPEQPAELLESVGFKRMLAALRTQFDLILIDSPPVLPVADPGIIAAQADGVLLIVRAGKTQRKTVLQAKELLRKMKANLIGIVMTHMDPGVAGSYHYYAYRRQASKPS